MAARSTRSTSLLLAMLVFVLIGALTPTAFAQSVSPTPGSQTTPDPFAGLSNAELVARTYGGGQVIIDKTFTGTTGFTRYLIHYPSDGLAIYGFMDVPSAAPRNSSAYPVIIALHGYIDPAIYTTLDYTTGYADALARAGYLVLHPDLRNYGPSDKGPNLLRVGFAVDVLNLIAIVRAQGGQPGSLQSANPAAIGLWGHSMGGGVALRVITVDPKIQAVVLYSPISGDDKLNVAHFLNRPGQYDANFPDYLFLRVSPRYFYGRIQAAVSIHQGLADLTVPPKWSADLCAALTALQKSVECFTYSGQPHTFVGTSNQLFIERMIAFFNTHLQSALAIA